MNFSLPLEGRNVAYQFEGHDQSNNVCEYQYEVNMSTNEKIITENTKLITQIVKEQCWISRSSECQGHNVCEYEVNRLTNERVIREKRNFNTNCLRYRLPARPDGFTNL